MNRDKKHFLAYLSFFYSFSIAIVACFLVLSLLNIKKDLLADSSYLLPFYRQFFFPKTYRLINYSFSIALIIATTFFLYTRIRALFEKNYHKNQLLFFFSIVPLVFLPFAFIITINQGIGNLDQYKYIFTLSPLIFSYRHILLFSLGMLILTFVFFFFPNRQKIIFHKYVKKLVWFIPLLSFILIVITLFDRTFDEKNLFNFQLEQYVHTVPLVASIHDVASGKVLLVNSDSQYGLFIIYFLSLIFKLIMLNFTNFFYLVIILGILYYLSIYLLLNIRLKSKLWAFIGLFPLFTFHFYATFDRYTRPMVFPLRYLLDMPFFILLLKADISKKKWSYFILPCYLGIAFFYNYEAGFSLTIAYLVFILLNTLRNENLPSLGSKAVTVIYRIGSVLLWTLSLAVLYSLYAKIKTGYYPDWAFTLFYLNIFSRGFGSGANDLPLVGFHLLTISVYLIVIVKSLLPLVKGYQRKTASWDISLAVYGLVILAYFIKSSYMIYLAALSIPTIILSVYLSKELFTLTVQNRKYHLFSLDSAVFFSAFLVIGSLLTFSLSFYWVRLSSNHNHPYWRNKLEQDYSANVHRRLMLSKSAIDKYEKDQSEVVILSNYDGFINLYANKTNALRLTNSQMILTFPQVESLLIQLKNINPKFIYADYALHDDEMTWRHIRYDIFPLIFDYIEKNYQKIDTIGILDVWQRRDTTIQ